MYIVFDDSVGPEIAKSNYTMNGNQVKTQYIGPISNLNLFVGENNSGKSRLLRGIMRSRNLVLTNDLASLSLMDDFEQASSGYSNILRKGFVKLNITQYSQPEERILSEAHRSLIDDAKQRNSALAFKIDVKYIEDFLHHLNSFNEKHEYTKIEKLLEALFKYLSVTKIMLHPDSELSRKVYNLTRDRGITIEEFNIYDRAGVISLIDNLLQSYFKHKDLVTYKIDDPQRLYIPTMRSATTLYEYDSQNRDGNEVGYKKLSDNIFRSSIEKNFGLYNDEQNRLKLTIATGLDLYSSIRRTRNNIREVRQRFDKFENFISKEFFEGRRIDIVAKDVGDANSENIIINIDEAERDIHDLGDGIQALIILMYNLYIVEDKSWVFIEEPELNMHPGLQRVLMAQLSKGILVDKELKIFITTHSNHLLDLSLEYKTKPSIFTIDKSSNSDWIEIDNVVNKDSKLLSVLGVQPSSVFLANCSLWVEGITDRRIIQSFLLAYQKENRSRGRLHLDIDYTFIEYGGSNLAHYLFGNDTIKHTDKVVAEFISKKIFLIVDRDGGKSEKHLKYLANQSDTFQYAVLPVREVENLISGPTLKKVLPKLFQKVTEDSIKHIKFNQSSFRSAYLGNYLQRVVPEDLLPKSFKEPSGTLTTYYKNKLASIILKEITWDGMSKAAQRLTVNVYEFIKKNKH